MSSPLSRFVRMLMLALVLGLASARPAVAADEGPSILRDTETEALFADIAKPLVEAANLDNKSVKVVLLNDDEINAFVAGSQNVYVNSGLLTRADNVNQLQFVIAHELGHVAGGHAIRMGEGMKEATGITLATMVLGAIAIAAGAGDAGLGLMMMGQRAAMGQFLAFTRAQETSADLAGASYLHKAG
ncbi:MAG TPA: M48 family metalloprotease, partial [Gaiellaceae bacterium]